MPKSANIFQTTGLPEYQHIFLKAWQLGIQFDDESISLETFQNSYNFPLRVATMHAMLHHPGLLASLKIILLQLKALKDPSLINFFYKEQFLTLEDFKDKPYATDHIFVEMLSKFLSNSLKFDDIETQYVESSKILSLILNANNSNIEHMIREQLEKYNTYDQEFIEKFILAIDKVDSSEYSRICERFFFDKSEFLTILDTKIAQSHDCLSKKISDLRQKYDLVDVADDSHDYKAMLRGMQNSLIIFSKEHSNETDKERLLSQFYSDNLNEKEEHTDLLPLLRFNNTEEQLAWLAGNPNIAIKYYPFYGENYSFAADIRNKTWAGIPNVQNAVELLGFDHVEIDMREATTYEYFKDNHSKTYMKLTYKPGKWDPSSEYYNQKYLCTVHDGNCGYNSVLLCLKSEYDRLSSDEKAMLKKYKEKFYSPFSVSDSKYASISSYLGEPISYCMRTSMFTPIRVISYGLLLATAFLVLNTSGLALSATAALSTLPLLILMSLTAFSMIGMIEAINGHYTAPYV